MGRSLLPAVPLPITAMLRRTFLRVALLACCAAFAAGPARALMAGTAPDTPAARVDANVPTSSWSSAVAVVIEGSAYSGVVVSPNHVLTAAHVAGGANPQAVTVVFNLTGTPVTRAVSAIAVFPGASFPYDDLSLITLSQTIPAGVKVLPVYTGSLPSKQVITLVGYGASGQGNLGPTVAGSSSVKRLGFNVADAVQTSVDTSGRQSLFYIFDFDSGSGTGALGAGSLGNGLEAGLASGDSGSPAFADIGGTRWLIGINNLVAAAPGQSAVDYRFGTIGGGMLLSDPRFVAWLQAQTAGSLGSGEVGDIPVPAWALATLASLLLGTALRQRRAVS